MRVTLGLGGTSADGQSAQRAGETTSLYRWLLSDPDLRGRARVEAGPADLPQGHMGDALDAVNVVLANSIALGSLVTSVLSWRGSRPRPSHIRLERDGRVIVLDDCSPETIDRILRTWDDDGRSAAPPADGQDARP